MYENKMRHGRSLDFGQILDDIFDAAKELGEEFKKAGEESRTSNYQSENFKKWFGSVSQEDNIDYFPNYSFPPSNIYMSNDRSISFEFALAGFDEKNISLSFQSDYMIFSATINMEEPEGDLRYFKRRLKLKDIEKQRYFVPADKFDQEKVRAVFKNGILKVTIPPREKISENEGVKIEIIKEGS